MMRQVVIQNRMMTGGFVVGNHVVSLGDVNCPILTVMGDADGIGVPGGVRKVAHVTPAATVYELVVARAGHFGFVVGSTAMDTTWPGVVGWVQWLEGNSNCPDGLTRVGSDVSSEPTRPNATLLATEGATRVLGFGFNAV